MSVGASVILFWAIFFTALTITENAVFAYFAPKWVPMPAWYISVYVMTFMFLTITAGWLWAIYLVN